MSVSGESTTGDGGLSALGNRTRTLRVDRADDRYLVRSTGGLVDQTIYVADRRTYSRLVIETGSRTRTTYDVRNTSAAGTVSPERASNGSALSAYTGDATYTVDRIERTSGAPVAVLVAADREPFGEDGFGVGNRTLAELDGARSVLHVRPAGTIIRTETRARYGVGDGRSMTVTISVTYAGIGSTDVAAPAWLDGARNAAANGRARNRSA